MSLSVQPRPFADALARVMAAVERSKEHPVLGHVLVTTSGGMLSLRSTDLNVEITTTLDCEGTIEPFCAPADRLQAAFARLVDRGAALFVLDAGVLTVSSGRSRFTMPTLSADLFPNLAMSEVGCTFTMPGHLFADLLKSCDFAIAEKDLGRAMLEGLSIYPGRIRNTVSDEGGTMLCAVATNGHKLSAREVPADLPPDLPPIIVPRKSVLMMQKLVAPWAELHIEMSVNRLIATFGPTRYVTKLIEATYPDWSRLIPRQAPTLSYDADVLVAAVQTAIAGVQADKKTTALMMSFTQDETGFHIDNTDGTAGGSDACAHSLLSPDAPDVQLGLNHRYFLEAIEALGSETIQLALTDGASPILLTCPNLPDRMALVMPRRA